MLRKPASKARDERLEARVSRDQKALFQRAAELQWRTLTDFVIAGVHEAAVRASEETQTIRLGARDSGAFAEAQLNPREPNARHPRNDTSSGPVPEWPPPRQPCASSPYRTGTIERASPAASSRWISICDSRRGQDARRRVASCFVLVQRTLSPPIAPLTPTRSSPAASR